ncbi:unnamed protein product [Cyclocybe aegerita]|uniref:Uncharacterized protein n=1 Tax=Cyclocybe aegerita TaxID=1973307 RepID=A0A8S0W3N0_CYCAE|nr:unnamed protein product [Cyclocybe aegerita]
MKLLSLVTLPFVAGAHTALVIPQLQMRGVPRLFTGAPEPSNLPVEVPQLGSTLGDAEILEDLCESGGKNASIAVKYLGPDGNNTTLYNFGDCILYEREGYRSGAARFCQTCLSYGHPSPDCSGGSTLTLPITNPKGLVLPDTDGGFKFLQQSAT